jgi:hypothetical protein
MKCKIKMFFTNRLPKGAGGKGFDATIEGGYDACLALVDEMRKAIVGFKEEDSKRVK